MTHTVYAHIGAYKSGTTYLQHVLWNNRSRLATEGILVPGEAKADQINAVQDLIDATRRGYRRPKAQGAWQRLVEMVAAWPGPTAVMSMESLSIATPEQIRKLVADLRPADLHVVLTARDLGRVLPSAWQQRIMNAKVLTWSEFMDGLTDPPEDDWISQGFWKQQDLPGILRRWSEAVPVRNIHVVTLPPPGGAPSVLLERFAEVIGADATTWDPDVNRRNESLGSVETELLRLVNVRLDENLPWLAYLRVVKNSFARGTLAGRANQSKLRLPTQYQAWAEARSKELVDALKADGYPVVGDLDELLVTASADSGPDQVPVDEVLAAAADTIAALVVNPESVAAAMPKNPESSDQPGSAEGDPPDRRT